MSAPRLGNHELHELRMPFPLQFAYLNTLTLCATLDMCFYQIGLHTHMYVHTPVFCAVQIDRTDRLLVLEVDRVLLAGLGEP